MRDIKGGGGSSLDISHMHFICPLTRNKRDIEHESIRYVVTVTQMFHLINVVQFQFGIILKERAQFKMPAVLLSKTCHLNILVLAEK